MTKTNSFASSPRPAKTDSGPVAPKVSRKPGKHNQKSANPRAQENRDDYQNRLKTHDNIQMWLLKESAGKLNSCQKSIAISRGKIFSRADLISTFIDELTEERIAALGKMSQDQGIDIVLALSSAIARGLDLHISESKKRSSAKTAGDNSLAYDEEASDDASTVSLGLADDESQQSKLEDFEESHETSMEPEIVDEAIGDEFQAFMNAGGQAALPDEGRPDN